MAKIVVIGAGVAGLTTALQLARKGHKVTIVAKHLPGDYAPDYTSPYAGAFFIHLASRNNPVWLTEIQDIASYYEILEIAAKDKTAGVWEREVNVYIPSMSMEEENYEGPWFKDLVRDYSVIPPEEYPEGSKKDGIVFAFKYTGFMITPVHYLHYLLFKCIEHGVKYTRKTVNSLQQAKGMFMEDNTTDFQKASLPTLGCNPYLLNSNQTYSEADIVINCAGLNGPKFDIKDAPNNMPIKGQTLLVENNCRKIIIVEPMDKQYPTESLYILPRTEGGSLLTGTYLYHDSSQTIDPFLTERIKARAIRYAPELVDSNFMKNESSLVKVREMVGIRPGRLNGAKVAREYLKEGDLDVVTNFGSGPNGYQNSFGLAKQVVQLVDEIVYEKKLDLKSKL